MASPVFIDPDDGNDSNTGFSEEQAFKTYGRLTGGVSGWNGVFFAREGTISIESPNWTGFSGVFGRSIAFGSGSTALSQQNAIIRNTVGNEAGAIIRHSAFNGTMTLEGFTIDAEDSVDYCINMLGYSGVTLAGKLILTRCTLKGAVLYGAITRGLGSSNGIIATDSLIQDCGIRGLGLFANNTDADFEVTDTIIHDCGQGIYSANGGGAPQVLRTLIYGCDTGVVCDGKSALDTPLLRFVTIDDCIDGYGSTFKDSSQAVIDSSIISNCSSRAISVVNTDPLYQSSVVRSYTNEYNNANPDSEDVTEGDGNLNTRPFYRDRDNADYRLAIGSPCRGAAYDGTDMGAYQFEVEELIEDSLRTFLLADATIASLVDTRVWGVHLPQKPTLPAVVISRATGGRDYFQKGASTLVLNNRFQIDCWGDGLSEARNVADSVRKRLSGYEGAAGDGTIHMAFLDDQEDMYDSELETNRVRLEFLITYTESIS